MEHMLLSLLPLLVWSNSKETKYPTLYNKISLLGNPSLNAVLELDDWVYNGNKVRVTELQRIIHDLRKWKRFSQALQISEWMNQKGICIFSPVEHVVQLDLIGKVEFCTNCCQIKSV
ncbi:hypothetical protein ACFX2A_006227 [Malus domestica]